ncbi:MAG: metallophosphoesterase [Bacteroidota bacterium]
MKKCLLLLVVLLNYAVISQVSAQATTVSPFASSWKYFATSAAPASTWKDSTFSDASWTTGTAYLGYGDTWITTCIPSGCSGAACSPSCGTKWITAYFRKVVNIPTLSIYDSIRLYLRCDDGAVVYVNGVEMFRDNLPTGTISFSTTAPSAKGGAAETTAVVKSFPISAFVPGNNTIAVEVHQESGTSSDFTFDLMVEGYKFVPTPVTLTRGPYLQVGSKTGMTFRWRSNVVSKSKISVGTTPGVYTKSVVDTILTTEHIVRIEDLLPDTKYYYSIGTDTSVLQGDTNNFFTTAPLDSAKRKVSIAVFGDCGRNDNGFQTGTLSAYQKYLASKGMKASEVLLLLGDNAYNSGTDAEFSNTFFSPYSGNILKNHPLYPAPGNHDYNNGSLTAQQLHNVPYYSIFSMPTDGECGGVPSETKAFYSFNRGGVHFLSLDSYGMEDYGTTRMYDTTGEQVKWIKKDLAADTSKWVIAYWHHPPYTKGSHNSDSETELVKIRENFIRILERMGVDLILTGHSHDYERSYLLKGHFGNEATFNKAAHTVDSSSAKYDGTANSCPYVYQSGKYNHGTVYVVAGSSGADGGVQAGYPHDAMPFSVDDGGMLYLEVEGNRLDAKFIRKDDTISDRFTIFKDVNKKFDTITIYKGKAATLEATWLGTYSWSSGTDTTRKVSVSPIVTTKYTVKDSAVNTCLMNEFVVKVLDTSKPISIAATTISGLDESFVYPVPAKDVLYLELNNTNEADFTFTIYDLQGRVLQKSKQLISTGKQNIGISVKSMPLDQVLMIKVENASAHKTFRFTRQE